MPHSRSGFINRGTARLAAAADWAFRDRRTGAITLAQAPNLPLWIFLGLSTTAWAIGAASPDRLPAWMPVEAASWLRAGAAAALVWWALDEVLRGVNPWRRCLGATVLAGLAFVGLGHVAG